MTPPGTAEHALQIHTTQPNGMLLGSPRPKEGHSLKHCREHRAACAAVPPVLQSHIAMQIGIVLFFVLFCRCFILYDCFYDCVKC